MTQTPDLDPYDSAERIGVEDPGGPVTLRRLPDGRAVLLPSAGGGRKLGFDGLDIVADIQATVRRLQAEREALDELVQQAREVRVPWHLIGFSVGTTPQAAQQRWGG